MDESKEHVGEPQLGHVPRVRFVERIGGERGLQFTVAFDEDAPDAITSELAAGRLPEVALHAIESLKATTPRGGRVLDLGTHVGTFTLAAAAMGYEVIGVEASPQNAYLLRSSLQRNGFDRVHLVNAAVSDRPGTLEFSQAGPYGHVVAPGTVGGAVSVPAVRIDDLLAERGWDRVDFIKMDIEGSEIAGLKGMHKLLSDPKAAPILVESNGHTLKFFDHVPKDLKAALAGYGYRNYLVESDRLYPVQTSDFQPGTCVDYLALKRSPAELVGYRVERPLSHDSLVDRLLQSAAAPSVAERGYIARALADAAPELLADPRVQDTLAQLRDDPDPSVRSAAAMVRQVEPQSSWRLRWHRGLAAIRAPFNSRRASRTTAGSESSSKPR